MQATPAENGEPLFPSPAPTPVIAATPSFSGYSEFGFSFGNYGVVPLGRYIGLGSNWTLNHSFGYTVFFEDDLLPCWNLSNDEINELAGLNSATRALVVDLAQVVQPNSVYDISPIIVVDNSSIPPRPASAYVMGNDYPQDAYIYWYENGVHHSGEDPNQVLYHELDHHFYRGGDNLPRNCIAASTSCLGTLTYTNPDHTITQFTWNLTPKYNTDGSLSDVSQGYADYEHLWIHNDLVNAYDTDLTGALAEAFGITDSDLPSPAPPPTPCPGQSYAIPNGTDGIQPKPTCSQFAAILTLFKNAQLSGALPAPRNRPPLSMSCVAVTTQSVSAARKHNDAIRKTIPTFTNPRIVTDSYR